MSFQAIVWKWQQWEDLGVLLVGLFDPVSMLKLCSDSIFDMNLDFILFLFLCDDVSKQVSSSSWKSKTFVAYMVQNLISAYLNESQWSEVFLGVWTFPSLYDWAGFVVFNNIERHHDLHIHRFPWMLNCLYILMNGKWGGGISEWELWCFGAGRWGNSP